MKAPSTLSRNAELTSEDVTPFDRKKTSEVSIHATG